MPRALLSLVMPLEGAGKVVKREGRTFVYVSAKVATDSAFPFKPGANVKVRIEGKRLVVE